MRLLDLFCGAGGAAMGYHQAGFDEIVGVDIKPQPRYPFHFVQTDALEFCASFGAGFDLIHASPPCQAYSIASLAQRRRGVRYPDLVGPTREHLFASGRPWVIENVPRAPIRPDVQICGCRVGLPLRRIRWFETSWRQVDTHPPHQHANPVVSVVGHGTPTWIRQRFGYNPTISDYRAAMGISWMTRYELSQAIPPRYTALVGQMALTALR
jgi:DNA (cytosine-5)-methyltransferase 1